MATPDLTRDAFEELTRIRERIEQLEDLCRAMYWQIDHYYGLLGYPDARNWIDAMEELGLLEGAEDERQ